MAVYYISTKNEQRKYKTFGQMWVKEKTQAASALSSHLLCAMASSRARLVPDPTVTVGDLCKAFEKTSEEFGCKDLARLLHSNEKVAMKSTPDSDSDWLGKDTVSFLFQEVFQVSQNGVLASKKLKTALLTAQTESGRINYSKEHDTDWADKMDDKIRPAASHYRELKKDSTK